MNAPEGTFFCPYCGRDLALSDETKEHVIPRHIGGNIEPLNPFSVPACRQCNNRCGAYVDGAFVRSWLVHNQRAANARRFLELSDSSALPLVYMGTPDLDVDPALVCEMWIGPAGDSIYHFHKPYPDEGASSFAGTPTHLRRSELDPGFVFVFVAASNVAWHGTIVRSVVQHFDGSRIFLGNGDRPPDPAWSEVPDELQELRARLGSLVGPRRISTSMRIDFGDRLLAKLALGFAAIHLDPEYLRSQEARNLRAFLWERDANRRRAMAISGTSFLTSALDGITSDIAFPFGHTIGLISAGDRLVLVSVFYGELAGSIALSSQPTWSSSLERGLLYVVVPGLRRAIGPMTLGDLLAERSGHNAVPALGELIARMESLPALPPFNIEGEYEARILATIRLRAYALWEARGRPEGDDWADWFDATRQLGLA